MSRTVGAKDKQKRAAGGGRKPKAFTLLKQRIESEKQQDAEYAFTMYASVMRDNDAPITLRLDCADWIANRVWGRPKEPIEHGGTSRIEIVYVDDWRKDPNNPTTETPQRTAGDSTEQGAV